MPPLPSDRQLLARSIMTVKPRVRNEEIDLMFESGSQPVEEPGMRVTRSIMPPYSGEPRQSDRKPASVQCKLVFGQQGSLRSKGLSVVAIVRIGLGSGLLSLMLSFTVVCIWLRVTDLKMAAEQEGKITQLIPEQEG
ncbi:hypothetical protein R6Q57_019299 [Mikania cordata]